MHAHRAWVVDGLFLELVLVLLEGHLPEASDCQHRAGLLRACSLDPELLPPPLGFPDRHHVSRRRRPRDEAPDLPGGGADAVDLVDAPVIGRVVGQGARIKVGGQAGRGSGL